MESAEAVAAKRRVLIDALMMCLSKSRVVQVVDAKTVRSVLDSASKELWREGEFRLEQVWKILIAQPGLTAEDVAPPLLVFKAYENELGVVVRVPQALSAIPRGEQIRLRDALGIERADFAKAIDELKAHAAADAGTPSQQQAARAAEAEARKDARKADARRDEPRKPPTGGQQRVAAPATPQSKALAVGLGIGGVVALAFGVWFTFRNPAHGFDLSDVAATVQLTDGKAVGPSLTATVADARWDAMSIADRKKAAGAVMDVEAGKGIKSLTLLDKSGHEAAAVNETPNGRVVTVP